MKITKEKNIYRYRSSGAEGISLIELLIYIAILSGLMVIISDGFIMLSKGRGQAEARSEVNAAIRFSSELIKQDIKNAGAIVTPALGTSSSTLTLVVGGSYVTYDAVGGVLRRTENGTTATTTGGSVLISNPTFTRIENYNALHGATTTAVQIALLMGYNASSTDWTYSNSLRTTVSLR